MNNLNKSSLFLVILLLLGACDAVLEEEPQNKLKPQTVSDYDELLNNGYPTTKDYGTVVALDYYTAMMTDDMDIRYLNSDRDEYPLHPFSFEEDHEDNSMMFGYDVAWKNLYQSIYYANVVIENVEKADGDAGEILYVKGEAKALRAFAYFKLINLYANPYDENTAASDLGVPLKLVPTVQSESYRRNSVAEVYGQIERDLTEGIQLMEENDQRVESKYKLQPISAKLLMSRIALYKKDYETAITYASEVISMNTRIFDLSPNTVEYGRSSWGYGQGENYLGEENDNVLFIYGSNEYYQYSYTPGALALSDDFINIFEDGDLRLFYFGRDGAMGPTYFKYRPYPFYQKPVRGFRVEEAYLNRAEAYAETDRTQEALEDINYLRRFKFSTSYSEENLDYYKYETIDFANKEEVINAVREERRRELFGEFHRWYDLRRYGMPQIEHHYLDEIYILPAGNL